MALSKLVAAVTLERQHKAGVYRILKAVRDLRTCEPINDLPDPPLQEYSAIWGMVDPEPTRWN